MSEGRYFCPQCGCEIHGAYAFCPSCGASLNPKKIQALFGNTDTNTEASVEEKYNDDSETKLLDSMNTEEETIQMPDNRPRHSRSQKRRNSDNPSRSAVPKSRRRMVFIIPCVIAAAAVAVTFLYMEGIIGVKSVDVFKGVSVSFTGVSPDARAAVTVDKDVAVEPDLEYVISQDSGIREGDSVTVYALEKSVADELGKTFEDADFDEKADVHKIVKKYHISPVSVKKEYEAKELGSYLTTADDIPEDVLNGLKDEMNTQLKDEAKNWGDASISGSQYVGTYFLSASESGQTKDKTPQNILYLVDRVDVKISNGDSFSYYYYLRYTNLVKDAKGNVDVHAEDSSEKDDTENFVDGSYIVPYRGYKTLDDLYNGEIADQSGYDIEKNIADEQKADHLTGGHSKNGNGLSAIDSMQSDNESTVSSNGNSPMSDSKMDSKPSPLGGHQTVDGQIFPNSSSELLTATQLDTLSKDEAQDAVNEIYARHGYIFKTTEIINYYRQFSWYHEDTRDMNSITFNKIESANLDALSAKR